MWLLIENQEQTCLIQKNFSLFHCCATHTKTLERVILNRITHIVDGKVINEHVGFRPGREYIGKILSFVQHIENGYGKDLITGTVFINHTAAYNIVNHRILKNKIYEHAQLIVPRSI